MPRSAVPSQSLRRAWLAAAILGLLALGGCAERALPLDMPYPAPVQKPVRPGEVQLEPSSQGVKFVPRARYFTQSYVMRTERYRLDPLAEPVPLDFALAWGPAAKADLQRVMTVSQSGRWYFWKLGADDMAQVPKAPSVAELNRSMANVHMVGATPEIRRALNNVKAGQTIQAEGYLVDLVHKEASKSRVTSLTRTDTGAGSCEIFYVTNIEVLEKAP